VTHDGEPGGSKTALRRQMRANRKKRQRRQRQTDAALLNRHLLELDPVGSATWVAGYLAFDGEPDIRFSLTQLCRRGIGVVLPVLPESPEGLLRFHRWTPATPLTMNRFGISEPRGGETVPLERIDTWLLPLVAFDRDGHRLGMGAGWYDRVLARQKTRATRIGIGWAEQEAPCVPTEPWDQSLDAVVTEREWFTCSR
jgi:5-formyltetrahydrofolate cyclo-ligase